MSDDDTHNISKVSVDWVNKDIFLGSDEFGHSIVFDSALTDNPPKGFGPMKTLLAALGACSGMDVAAILGKRKQKFSSIKIEISGKRNKYGHPKPYTEIHMSYVVSGKDLEDRYVKEAVKDSSEKYCSVAATINEKAKITSSYKVIDA